MTILFLKSLFPTFLRYLLNVVDETRFSEECITTQDWQMQTDIAGLKPDGVLPFKVFLK